MVRMTFRLTLLLASAVTVVTMLVACRDEQPAAPAPGASSANSVAPVSPAPGASPAPSASAAPVPDATPAQVTYAAPGPATFTVIGGRNDGPIDIEQFLPSDVHIRVGDTIEWVSRGFEGHTVTFSKTDFLSTLGAYLVPDAEDPRQVVFNPKFALRSEEQDTYPNASGLINSGFIGVPQEGTYRITFTEKGIYQYLCVVHPLWMRGTVSVDDAGAPVESPESVAARGQTEYERLVADAKRVAGEARAQRRSFPAPDGATLHRVAVGLTTPYGQIANFVDAALTIAPGDTVIFENDERNFHNVVFKGAMAEPPPAYEIRVDLAGRGFNVALAAESAAAVDPPAAGFDDTTFLSSGTMGIQQPRQTWRLTFTQPGTYIFNCTIHQFAGMAGVIIVK